MAKKKAVKKAARKAVKKTTKKTVKPRRARKTTRPKKAAFLAAYAKCGNITQAAKIAGCGRKSHYEWLEKDADYQALFDMAHEEACDSLEQEARRRAVDGWDEPVFQNGMLVGKKRKFSDTLMIFLMKGAMPEKYKERVSQEVNVDVSATAQIIEDDDWYGNKQAIGDSAEADGTSDTRTD